jgi:hypothetical protein
MVKISYLHSASIAFTQEQFKRKLRSLVTITAMTESSALSLITNPATPLWMRRAKRGYDRGLLLMLLLSLLPALSFLLQPGISRTNDLERYIFQIENTAQALSEGRLYPRWSANALLGYGAPIPHFTPPLPVYASGVVELFVTGNAVTAAKIVMSIALLCAGAAIYSLVWLRGGTIAGLIAGILYLYSPFIGLVVPYLTGDLPLILMAALLPGWLWSVHRLHTQPGRTNIVVASFLSASLMLTKPEAAVIGYLLAILAWASRKNTSAPKTGWNWLAIVILLGVGMASFFWLPALIEASEIHWVIPVEALPRTLTVTAFFTVAGITHANELNPQPYYALGIAQIVCCIASAILMVRLRQWRVLQTYFLGAGVVLCFAAVTFFEQQVWLLCPIALCIAIGGSGIALWIERTRRHNLTTVTIIAVLVIVSMPILYGVRWSDVPFDTSAEAEVNFERLGFGVASLPDGQSVPTNLAASTPPNQALLNGYSTGDILKIDSDASSSRIQIGVLAHTTHADRFQLFMSAPTTLRVLTNYFPGWFASFNGATAPLQPSAEGFMDVSVGERSGELVVEFGTTLARTLAWLLSWTFLAAMLVIAFRRPLQHGDYDEESRPLSRPVTRALLVIILGCYGIFVAFALPASPVSALLLPNEPHSSVALAYRTSEGLEAVSYSSIPAEASLGGTFDFTMYWRALRFLPANYQTQIVLINGDTQEEITVSPVRHIGGLPSQRWATQRLVVDPYSIELPSTLPTGNYAIAVDVFACLNQQCNEENRLAFFDAQGASLGERIVLPQNLVIR